ncbi:geranylgeranyl transferase type-1 subunit beta isoform X2 [Silene latifolia]|uniref:geranylgeranyl transferase type-1 subunit beta isoform X2 n=1 Tax=Silene latifolia TaxID=37657 RepID=UPI003D789FB8
MASEAMKEAVSVEQWFDKDRHIRFINMMYEFLPTDYESQEINHLTLAYFTLSSLDILGSLHRVDKGAVITWVLSFQTRQKDEAELSHGQFYGFQGSRSSQYPAVKNESFRCNGSHLASTYCALCILKMLGDDFSLVNSESITRTMRNLQQPDGSFIPIHTGAESDLRFLYCAAAISCMLNDWSGVDKDKAKEYILNCQSYDGGFGLSPGLESHGGATFCAIASLRLMGFIDDNLLNKSVSSSIINVPMLLDWVIQALDGGFQGRANKPSDTCYAFWIGGVLKILGGSQFVHREALRDSLLTCQSQYGGFSKFRGQLPELYHSYYGFSAFSLLEEPGLSSLCTELGITNRAAKSS